MKIRKSVLILFLCLWNGILFSQIDAEEALYKEADQYIYFLNGEAFGSFESEEIRQDKIDKASSSAYTLFKQLVHEYPNSDRYLLYCYYTAVYSPTLHEAVEYYDKIFNKGIKDYYYRRSHLDLCFLYINENQFEKALYHYNKILELPIPLFTCGVERDVYDSKMRQISEALTR